MSPPLILATTYDGFFEGMLMIGIWILAAALSLIAAALVLFEKSRRAGRIVAKITAAAAALQFAFFSFHLLKDEVDRGTLEILFISIVPLLISGLLIWATPKPQAQQAPSEN